MTESASDDQILELATSSAAGLGPWRIEGYRFTDGQWHAGLGHGAAAPPGLAEQLAALGSQGAPGPNSGQLLLQQICSEKYSFCSIRMSMGASVLIPSHLFAPGCRSSSHHMV